MMIILLITMFFCHIVDDYYLQGCLANMKQKSWWEKQTSNKLYKYDYLMALVEHAFSWAFMIMLPLLIYMLYAHNLLIFGYIIAIVVNCIIHAFIDDLKANKLLINLVIDQLLHFLQIIITWLIFYSLLYRG